VRPVEGRYRHFVAQVEAYHREWRALFASMMVAWRSRTPASYDEFPHFVYRAEPFGAVLWRTAVNLAVLLLAAGVTGAAGAVRLRQYPVT
jgi:hypothetical protein